MFASRLAAGGLLLLALLALALDGKPAPPQLLHKAPAGGTTVWQRQLTEEASGPAAGGGGGGGRAVSRPANAAPTAPKSKGAAAAAAAASRLLRDLRPDGKQSRAAWGRMVHPEHHAGGGGGGGGGSRRLKGVSKKGLGEGCSGLKLDRIGSMSGLAC
uniref:C-type natriuretic peptide 1f n=1 Tax=Hypsiglena sp. JMG-2014 TaxID=1550645 RepID=A0A098M231_9SAUR